MADLPIDPAEYPGTPEYEELQDERKGVFDAFGRVRSQHDEFLPSRLT